MVRFDCRGIRKLVGFSVGSGLFLAGFLPLAAQAVPSMARQTGMQCTACHTVFPELTSFGRQFKLRGYSLGNARDDAKFPANLPLAGVIQASVTSTRKADGVDPELLPRDGKLIAQAAGLYYGGKITEKSGALVQYSYDGIEGNWALEMADVRWADSATLGGKELVYGVTLNNAPTLSDIYNSTPVWSFPHVEIPGMMPAASTLIDMTLMSQVGGVGVYGMWNNLLYGEVAMYRTARSGIMRPMKAGGEVENVVEGYAPYWRFALEREAGPHHMAVGTFGMRADVFPDPEALAPPTDRFRDIGFDLQHKYIAGDHVLTSHATWIREKQSWNASFAQGMTSNPSSTLRTLKLDSHYYYQRRFGGGIEYFLTRGDTDMMKYNMGEPVMGSVAGNPNTTGWRFEFDYLPVQNVKLSVIYTAYTKFNGARTDYDGFGRNASANNNLFLLGWFMF